MYRTYRVGVMGIETTSFVKLPVCICGAARRLVGWQRPFPSREARLRVVQERSGQMPLSLPVRS